MNLKQTFRQMALTPQVQLRRLMVGTLASTVFMALIYITSDAENVWLFYLLAFGLLLSVIYAIPGYIGIWLWRMRKFLFDIDD